MENLLELEIKFKEKRIETLARDIAQTENCIKGAFTFLDFYHAKSLLDKSLNKCMKQIEHTHNKKLYKLGINFKCNSNFCPDDIIFNLSDYNLTKKEKAILALGLDFKLPCFKPSFTQMFLPFEKLCKYLKYTSTNNVNFEKCCFALKTLVHNAYSSLKKTNTWFPFFKKSDLLLLKNLGSNKNCLQPGQGKRHCHS